MTAFRCAVIGDGGATRTLIIDATSREEAILALLGDGLTPVDIASGEPSLIDRLHTRIIGAATDPDVIERIGLACIAHGGVRAGLVADRAGIGDSALVDRLMARGSADIETLFAAEPGLPAALLRATDGPAEEGAALIAIAGRMRALAGLRAALVQAFLPVAALLMATLALLIGGPGGTGITAAVAAAMALSALRPARHIRLALRQAEEADPDRAARCDLVAHTIVARTAGYAQAAAILAFAGAVIFAMRG